jgi:transcriptional regulator with XRE-family HTH domain
MDSKLRCANKQALASHIASMSGKELAAVLGVDASAASRIKSGERGLSIDEVVILISSPSAQYPYGIATGQGDGVFVDRDEQEALESLARKYLEAKHRRRDRRSADGV